MKNKALLFLGTAVVAAVVGGVSAFGVSQYLADKSNDNNQILSFNGADAAIGDAVPQAGNHFAAYAPEQYPDCCCNRFFPVHPKPW